MIVLELYLAERAELLAGVERLREALQTEGYDTGASLEDVLDTARFAAAFRKPDDVRNGAALERIRIATQAAGWPVGETPDDLVAAVAAVSAGRDALAADNARLMADSQALAAVGRCLVSAGRGPVDGHTDIVHIVQAVADVLDECEEVMGSLHDIRQALAHVGRRDVGRHPAAVACAVEEALAELSARWRGRDDALEQIRAMDMAPSSPADIADTATRTLATLRATHHDRVTATMLGGPAWLDVRDDVLRPAPATGGDCGGALVRQASAGELDVSCGCGTTDTVVDEDRCCVRCGHDVILVADRYSHELVEQLRAELDAAKAAEVQP